MKRLVPVSLCFFPPLPWGGLLWIVLMVGSQMDPPQILSLPNPPLCLSAGHRDLTWNAHFYRKLMVTLTFDVMGLHLLGNLLSFCPSCTLLCLTMSFCLPVFLSEPWRLVLSIFQLWSPFLESVSISFWAVAYCSLTVLVCPCVSSLYHFGVSLLFLQWALCMRPSSKRLTTREGFPWSFWSPHL